MVTIVKHVREHEFIGDDESPVKGSYFYLQVIKDDGVKLDKRHFISEDRLAGFAFIPKAGDKVLVYASDGKIIDMLQDK